MSESVNITQINGIIQELQRQNTQLSSRCAELSGVLAEAEAKIKELTATPDEAA